MDRTDIIDIFSHCFFACKTEPMGGLVLANQLFTNWGYLWTSCIHFCHKQGFLQTSFLVRMQLRKIEIFIWSLPTTDCFDVLRLLSGWLRGVLPGGANKVCICHHRVVLEYVYSLHEEQTHSSTTTSKGGDDEDEDCDGDGDDDADDDDDLHWLWLKFSWLSQDPISWIVLKPAPKV